MRRTTWSLPGAVVAAALMAAGCGGEQQASPPESTSPSASAEPTATESSPSAEPLPEPLSLRQVRGRTIPAEPFADFAVADGSGVWVSGVDPGLVRYDGASGRITARVEVAGAVEQALEASAGSVWVPTDESELLRVGAANGRVLARTRLPSDPLTEGVVGADGDTAYVIVDPARPQIAVVKGGRVTDRLRTPRDAVAVRAAYGSLWVPTALDSVERYDLASKEWSSIAVGPSPRFLDAGFGAVWVMNQSDGSVTRIDGTTGAAEPIPAYGYPIRGGDLTCGPGAVWLRTDDSVLRIDPRSLEVTHYLELPPGSGSVAATRDSLWITNHDHFAVHRVPLPLPE